MTDTPPEIEERLRAMYAQRSPEERVKMASSMFDTAKALLKAGFLARKPDISAADLRWEVFLALYGDCYDDEEKAKIRTHLEAFASA